MRFWFNKVKPLVPKGRNGTIVVFSSGNYAVRVEKGNKYFWVGVNGYYWSEKDKSYGICKSKEEAVRRTQYCEDGVPVKEKK